MDDKKLKSIEKLIEIQSSSGNYDQCSYMHGLANGMILIHSILTEKEPIFLNPPKVWLQDEILKLLDKSEENPRPFVL